MPQRSTNKMPHDGVRQRGRRDVLFSDGNELPVLENVFNRTKTRPTSSLPSSVILSTLVFISAIFSIQLYMEHVHLPRPLLLSDAPNHPGEFIAERAMERLQKLIALGPRVSGSEANEKLAVNVLTSEVQQIIKLAHSSKRVELDVGRVSGAYPLRFLDGLTNHYRNVPNVVVRLSSSSDSQHSLLVNCHFDSVPDSPGGSDDGASCANMLEILHVIATSSIPLKHNIIFLFNGAEENLMHASHGFITQHRWAKEIRAFVNLEACGAGGREVLFQSGPNSPWIIETYANSVPRPFGSSMAQEIFESGIVPGDTDFRVFRDFGNLSGLDMAWSSNGYVYHTRFDDASQIPLGTLQRTGENVLQLLLGLANAPQLEQPEKHRPGNLVYFDVLGLFVVRWSETVANILNVSAVAISLAAVALNRRAFERQYKKISYGRELCKALGVVVAGSVMASAVSLGIGCWLAWVGRTMSWYGHPVWLLLLYVIPTITTTMALLLAVSSSQLKTVKSNVILVQLYYDVYQLIWTAVLVVGIAFQIRSSCLAWLWVVSPSLASLLQRILNHAGREPGRGYLFLYLVGLALPVLQFSGMQIGVISLFIPILGRAGSSVNPDIVIGIYSSYTFAMLFSYAFPLIFLENKPGRLLKVLASISLVSLILLTTTEIGFPYSSNPAAPRPQRYLFVHTERVFHNYSKEVNRESGYWIIDMDFNTPEPIKPFVAEAKDAMLALDDCDSYLYCGMPYLMPALSLVKRTHWIPGPAPSLSPAQQLKLVSREFHPQNGTMRLLFQATGPDHMGLIFSPRPDSPFRGWSVSASPPVAGTQWRGQDTFFVYYANALNSSQPWDFFIDLQPDPKRLKKPMIDIALTGHHLHGPHQRSAHFQTVIDQFPPWAAVTGWTASYQSYIY